MSLNSFTGMLVVFSSTMLAMPAAANPPGAYQSPRQVSSPSSPGQPFRPTPRDVSKPPARPSPPSCLECPTGRGGAGRPAARPNRVLQEENHSRQVRTEGAKLAPGTAAAKGDALEATRADHGTPLEFSTVRRPLTARRCPSTNRPTTRPWKQTTCPSYGAPLWEDEGL